MRAAAARRAEAGDPGRPHRVGDPGDQRRLGPDDDQIGRQLVASAGTASGSAASTPRCSATAAVPALPGAHDQRGDAGILRERENERVLTSTGTDHEDAHDPTS